MMERRWAKPVTPRQQMTVGAALDDSVPATHPIRMLDAVLAELDWSEWLARFKPDRRGQPPVHPRLMAGCIMYGLMRKIRSSRELEEATRERVDFRWFLEERTIDHATFALFRGKFKDLLQGLNHRLAERICAQYADALETLVVDGTRIRACSDRHGARTAEGLEKMIARCTGLLDERLRRLEAQDDADTEQAAQVASLEEEVARLRAQLGQYQKAAVAARERDGKRRKKMGAKAPPVRVPVTDPDASIVPNKEGGYAPNYTPTAAVDAASGAIVSCGVPEGASESDAVPPAVADAKALGGTPKRVMADGGFSGGEVLHHLAEQGIEACMPTATDFRASNPANREDPSQPVPQSQWDQLPKTSGKGGKLRPSAFIHDNERDEYRCPMGHALLPESKGRRRGGARTTVYTCHHCAGCPLAKQCLTAKTTRRTISRDPYQPLREAVGRRMASDEEIERYKTRAPLVEVVFARIKYHFGIRQFFHRGLDKVRAEWNWVCCAYNLKLLLQLLQNKESKTANLPQTA